MEREPNRWSIVNRRLMLVSMAALTVAFLWVSQAKSDYFYVTNTADSGPGTLRQAIVDANAHTGSDVVVFAIGAVGSQQSIWLNSALPTITDTTDVHGWSQGGPGSQKPSPTPILPAHCHGGPRSRSFAGESPPGGCLTAIVCNLGKGVKSGRPLPGRNARHRASRGVFAT